MVNENKINKLFAHQLKKRILSLLVGKKLSFEKIVEKSDGPTPSEIKELLDNLILERLITYKGNKYYIQNQAVLFRDDKNNMVNSFRQVSLSDPHPADYDWRFDSETLKKLKDYIDLLSDYNADTKIALLGTTTLFPVLVQENPNTILINKSVSQIEDLNAAGYADGIITHDLFEPFNFPIKKCKIVVADPPWYLEFYRAFIIRASELLEKDGYMLLSVMSESIRPNAKSEISTIRNFAEACGFILTKTEGHFLRYSTPKFEKNSLRIHNINIGNWRKGNLYLFQKVHNSKLLEDLPRPKEENEWTEFKFNSKIIKLKTPFETDLKLPLEVKPADDQDVLGSVSRRYAKREAIDFWTSDNIALSVSRIDIIHSALKRCKTNMGVDAAIKSTIEEFNLDEVQAMALKKLISFCYEH